MNQAKKQLEERDVKLEAPMQNPVDFMRRYLASNFPQTAAMPSVDQKAMQVPVMSNDKGLKLEMKKPLNGTSFDNPAGS
jgi:hypothetical protein